MLLNVWQAVLETIWNANENKCPIKQSSKILSRDRAGILNESRLVLDLFMELKLVLLRSEQKLCSCDI